MLCSVYLVQERYFLINGRKVSHTIEQDRMQQMSSNIYMFIFMIIIHDFIDYLKQLLAGTFIMKWLFLHFIILTEKLLENYIVIYFFENGCLKPADKMYYCAWFVYFTSVKRRILYKSSMLPSGPLQGNQIAVFIQRWHSFKRAGIRLFKNFIWRKFSDLL